MLGIDMELQTEGTDADITERRKEAVALIQNESRGNTNTRQTMLMYKEAHGSGVNPSFPTADEIDEAMQGHEETHMIPIYGDGSQTTPTKWWAALGGYGAWIPRGDVKDETKGERATKDVMGPTIGQTGSSTRQELMAWISILAMPIRSMYATDSAAMLDKAKSLLAEAQKVEEAKETGKKVNQKCPFNKPWGCRRMAICGKLRGKQSSPGG